LKNRNTNLFFKIYHENKPLIFVFITLIIILLFLLPKIYLRNNIYYLSKEINTLYAQYISLKEEKRFLEQQLEKKEYENQITDSLLLNDLKLLSNKNK
jgi:cell division protein FtsL